MLNSFELMRLRYYFRHPLIWLELQPAYWKCRSLTKQLLCRIFPLSFLQWVKLHVLKNRTTTAASRNLSNTLNRLSAYPEDQYSDLVLLQGQSEKGNSDEVIEFPAIRPLHKPDIICFSIIDWNFRFQRPQQLMSQFAERGHRVFYISTTEFQYHSSSAKPVVRQIRERIYEIQLAARRMPDVYGEVFVGDNAARLLESLDELRRDWFINEAIGYVMVPSWAGIALEGRKRWGWQVLYDCMDDWEHFPKIAKGIVQIEQKLVKECDLLVVTAQRLFDKWKAHNSSIILARNAADYDFYAKRCQPNERLAKSKSHIIGYFGAIADWFDLRLMAEVARSRPDYRFVLIGGVYDVNTSELQKLPNVLMTGNQPYDSIPEYLWHFDVCIIPFKVSAVTEATDPVKLYEYWCGGKPVVSVRLSEVTPYHKHVYLAEDAAGFANQIDRALTENNADREEQRREFVKQHTWAARVGLIEEALQQAKPRVSIIIVTYNNLVMTKLCLDSLIRNTEYSNYEVIVIDNNSADETPSFLKNYARDHDNVIVTLNTENYGFAKANNQGLALATGEYFVLLNNDTVVPPGWLSRLLWHLRDSQVGLVGPMTNAVGNEAKVQPTYRTWGEMEKFAQAHAITHDQFVGDIYMLAMFCLAMRREVWQELGPLDERFGIGMFEDDDYSVRARKNGYRVVCAADVFIHHFGQAAFKKLIEAGTYNPLFERNRNLYEAKWGISWKPHVNAPLSLQRHQYSVIDPPLLKPDTLKMAAQASAQPKSTVTKGGRQLMNKDIGRQNLGPSIDKPSALNVLGLSDDVLRERLVDQHWTSHNIRLSESLTTMPGQPDFVKTDLRLHAILRILNAFYRGSLNDLKVADLGCLEGGFALVLAQQGAEVTGIEARLKNLEKALLLQEHFGLSNLHFVSGDVKDFTPEKFSSFDVTLALGILYHLDCPVEWLAQTSQLTKTVLIVDTHFAPATDDDLKKVNKNIASLSKLEKIEINGHSYEGRWFYEFDKKDDPERHLWASYSNHKSFWLTKESLLLALQHAGFDLVLEQHDYSASFYQYFNTTFPRGMFVAVKSSGLVQ